LLDSLYINSKENIEKVENMTLIVNTTVTDYNKNAYSFEARGTEYTVIDNENGLYDVYSNRKNVSFMPQIAVMTMKEMKARSKALAHLGTLIGA
tara:strand:+ start:508 stop:789 length:282 start_codon:yes stop_codon:yes gene_type:complete